MKSITNIQFVNYKAFYNDLPDNNIDIPFGKNVLIYGENGSGKSSIYEGLKQFFNSANTTVEEIPSRHIRVPKLYEVVVNEGADDEFKDQKQSEVAVKITFADSDTSTEQKIFGVPNENVKGTKYISNANLLNSFLSYRELLKTYLMDNLKDREEFRKKFAFLLFEVILAKNINSATQKTYYQSWDDLFLPKVWYKEENLEKFITGANFDIDKINLILSEIVHFFDPSLYVRLIITDAEIEYHHSEREGRFGKYPIVGVDLEVKLFGENVENDEENHLTVLNEARLSSLAISIYLATLVNTPQQNFDYKILFLDDIFIGLDMGNRKPLLQILTEFKKPLTNSIQDEETGKIVEVLSEINGVIQYEAEPFFKDYQIFVTTYDRYWFGMAKSYFQSNTNDKWHFIEVFANTKVENNFNTPIVYTALDYIQKAVLLFQKHDYPSCANHIRKAVESRVKYLLPTNLHYGEYIDTETGLKEIKKLKSLSQYLDAFIKYCDENNISVQELIELKNLKEWYFNPFSHDNIGTPIYRKELERALKLAQELEKLNFPVIAEAGLKLYFNFDDGNGETRQYKIETQEHLRSIRTEGTTILSNPIIKCYEWTKNGDTEIPNWGTDKLFHFYNNKLRGLLQQKDKEDIPIIEFWEILFLIDNNQSIKSIITI